MSPSISCPFCTLDQRRILIENELGRVIRDGFPVSLGHTLIIQKRHVGSFFDVTEQERASLLGHIAALAPLFGVNVAGKLQCV